MVRDRFKKVEDELVEENIGRTLLSVPDDCLTRPQRETLVTLLLGRIQAIDDTVDVSPSQWKLALAVLKKLMNRPTFCEVSLTYHLQRFFEQPCANKYVGTELRYPGNDRGEGLTMLRDRFRCLWVGRDEELDSLVLRAGYGYYAVRSPNPLTHRSVILKLTLPGKWQTITTRGVKSSSTKPRPTSLSAR